MLVAGIGLISQNPAEVVAFLIPAACTHHAHEKEPMSTCGACLIFFPADFLIPSFLILHSVLSGMGPFQELRPSRSIAITNVTIFMPYQILRLSTTPKNVYSIYNSPEPLGNEHVPLTAHAWEISPVFGRYAHKNGIEPLWTLSKELP